jgi:carbonic anhydrase
MILTRLECILKESVNVSLSNCLTYRFVKKAVQAGTLTLHGAYFDFVNAAFEHWLHNKSSESETF